MCVAVVFALQCEILSKIYGLYSAVINIRRRNICKLIDNTPFGIFNYLKNQIGGIYFFNLSAIYCTFQGSGQCGPI